MDMPNYRFRAVRIRHVDRQPVRLPVKVSGSEFFWRPDIFSENLTAGQGYFFNPKSTDIATLFRNSAMAREIKL
jgi:hypothetical protein